MSCQKPRPYILQTIILYFLSALLLGNYVSAQEAILNENQITKIANIIDKVRTQTRTPGISVGLVYPDPKNGTSELATWQYQAGYADITAKTPLEDKHVFRTGSISKLVVSIAIMQLVEKQQLTLQSRLSDVLPELSFSNPWKNTHPLLVSHLLNHSSGWEAPHFAANIPQQGKPITTKKALALHPETRVSRWQPGTRTAYNNTGYLVLAAIVEKLANIPFEQYVKNNIFKPLEMTNSDYFFTDSYKQNAVSHYKGGKTVTYLHLNNRPGGALNSSSSDLLKLVQMMMSRDETLLSLKSKQLMMSPSFSHYSAEGVQIGWGLGVTQITRGGVTWYGHEGSLPGATAFVGWEPSRRVGISVLINNNSPAISALLNRIGEMLSTTTFKTANTKLEFNAAHQSLSGHYLNIAPISSWASLTSALPWKIQVQNNQAFIKPFGSPPRPLRPGKNGTFLHHTTDKIVLATGQDPLEGKVIYYGPNTLKKVSGLRAWFPVASIALFVLSVLITLVFGLIWLLVWQFKKSSRKQLNRAQRLHRLLPLCGAMTLVTSLVVVATGFNSTTPFILFGQATLHSVSLFLCSVLLPLLLLLQLLNLVKFRDEVRAPVTGKTHKLSGFMSYAHLITGMSFISVMTAHGYVGIATWL